MSAASHPPDEHDRLRAVAGLYHRALAQGTEQAITALSARYALDWMRPPVLELGCGNGTWTRMLAARFGTVDVVDAAPELLDALSRELGEQVRCHPGLIEDFDTDERYGTVLLAGVLHHVADPVAIARRAARWIDPEGPGQLLVTVPNAQSLHRRLGKAMGQIDDLTVISPLGNTVGHRRVYTREQLHEDVARAGLRIVREQGLFLKPFANAQLDTLPRDVLEGLFDVALELPAELATLLLVACEVT